ncbi:MULTISPECIES: DUF1003 domain-containing protein [unclassified Luteibacter]|uniref:DUF1003 domain-containing protein n=1 Tax=unclassified Luteibacter TaxID=2620188 RepID=UPI0008BA133A|nr:MULTISPECIES: DUF1003 domain-containing protein [unclassified Luteibacter]MDR6936127.1 putative membrane protein [Luteibacter sp. 3190]SEO55806.1 Uncharacterized membrane protein [Luteibacter sp. UNC138MFCol5.1]
MSMTDPEHVARHWFSKGLHELGHAEQRLLDRLAKRKLVSEDVNAVFRSDLTFGERLADNVSRFGGSWTFIIVFAVILMLWTGVNSFVLKHPFDPYPYIFLNLMLSMLAAVQAPVIMMSQNRQAAMDRLDAANDYKVNLKAEIEIMGLHDKLDQIRTDQLAALLMKQQEQIDLLMKLVADDDARKQGD